MHACRPTLPAATPTLPDGPAKYFCTGLHPLCVRTLPTAAPHGANHNQSSKSPPDFSVNRLVISLQRAQACVCVVVGGSLQNGVCTFAKPQLPSVSCRLRPWHLLLNSSGILTLKLDCITPVGRAPPVLSQPSWKYSSDSPNNPNRLRAARILSVPPPPSLVCNRPASLDICR